MIKKHAIKIEEVMSTYLLINIVILFFPAVLSFDSRVRYISKIKSVAFAGFFTGVPFVVWDMIVTARGHWSFNPAHVSDIKVINIPIEEVLFFVTVPYACIFIYECFVTYVRFSKVTIMRKIALPIGIILLVLSALTYDKEYTFIVLLLCGVFILYIYFFRKELFEDNRYWLTIISSFAAFSVFNVILTALPIVMYGDEFNSGIRVYTVPVEDGFYNYLLISLNIFLYRRSREKYQSFLLQK